MSWQDKLRQVEPYVAGEQPKINNMIKLNTNENPYGPCKQIKDILKEIDIEKLKLYPNSDGEELRHALAKYHGLKDEQVFLGNGSDEVLALTFLPFFNGSTPVLFPNISYSFYPVYCDLYQMNYKEIILDQDFKMYVEDFKQPNSGIIFPNPNAPTGLLVSLDFIEEVLKSNNIEWERQKQNERVSIENVIEKWKIVTEWDKKSKSEQDKATDKYKNEISEMRQLISGTKFRMKKWKIDESRWKLEIYKKAGFPIPDEINF